jgi:hypothetical protein
MSDFRIQFGVDSPRNRDPFNISAETFRDVESGEIEKSDLDYEQAQAYEKLKRNRNEHLISAIADNLNGNRDQAVERLQRIAAGMDWDEEVEADTYGNSGDPYLLVSSGGNQGQSVEEHDKALEAMGF